MSPMESMAHALREHMDVCRQLLLLSEQENAVLGKLTDDGLSRFHDTRKALLPRLKLSVDSLKALRFGWQRLSLTQRKQAPVIGELMREAQDLILKVLALEQENQRGRLQRGLLPVKHLPSANQGRPHFVADLYRRHGSAPPG